VRPGVGLPPIAITPDGKLATGQRFYKVSHRKCQLIKGEEKKVLEREDGCSVFTVKKECWLVSETFWAGPPETLIQTTDDGPNPKALDLKASVATVVVCPERVTIPGGDGGGDPPVWLPPREQKWGTGQAYTSTVVEPTGKSLTVREVWEKLVPRHASRGVL
jgi:hypothetical protein